MAPPAIVSFFHRWSEKIILRQRGKSQQDHRKSNSREKTREELWRKEVNPENAELRIREALSNFEECSRQENEGIRHV